MSKRNFSYLLSISDTFREYTKKSSIPGYQYITRRSKLERLFWYFVHLTTLCCTYYILSDNWVRFTRNPTSTTLETYLYPIDNVPMPGISVCNLNKLSKWKSWKYATDLANTTGFKAEEMFEFVKLFGRFYDNNLAPKEEELAVTFQNILESQESNDFQPFNVYETLNSLSFSCSEIISDCRWQGESYNCNDLFVTELTMEGNCCIFNYYSSKIATSVSRIIKKNKLKPLTTSAPNRLGGLTVKIYSNVSDYLYTTLATTGTKILFSNPTDFPDVTSGALIEKLVPIGTEIFFKISSTTVFSTDEIRKYPIQNRECIFRDEQTTLFGGYSYSDCIVDCKIESILALCGCIPFNYISVFGDKELDQCTLSDLKCLSSYVGKIKTMYPTGYDSESDLDREKQDSLQCSHCMPACTDTVYKISNDLSQLWNPSNENLHYSIIHVFFEEPNGVLNKQDVFFYWYDVISLFGGLCSLIMGVSIISLVEIIYFITYRYYLNLLKNSKK